MMKLHKMSDARKFSCGLLATLLFIGLLSLESHAAVTVGYTFSDGNAVTATNSGDLGAAVNGTITGGSIIASPFSADNQALLFNGNSNANILMPNLFGYGGAFTVEALVRLDSLNSAQDSLLLDDFGAPGVLLGVFNSTQKFRTSVTTVDDGTIALASTNTFSLGTWHHVATVYDGAMVQLYIDGLLVDSQAATGDVDKVDLAENAGFTPRIGSESQGFDFNWVGAIDDFRIHDTALMASEFNDGNPLPPIPIPAAVWMLGSGLLGLIGLSRRKLK